MQEQPLKYVKRLVFDNSVKLKEFLGTFLETDVSRHVRLTTVIFLQDVPSVGKAVFREVLLEPTSDVSCVQAMTMRLLDASLLDGMLRHWKGNLAKLEPDAVPA